MHFRMNESGLYYFDLSDQEFTFVNTFTARYIKGEQFTRDLCATLIYPSANDYNWIICRNQIKNCPVTVQDVEVAQKVWGKIFQHLKARTL